MKLGFYSCMSGVRWGGSEELWYRAAKVLGEEGHEILVNFKWWADQSKKLTELEAGGAKLWLRAKPPTEQKRSGLAKLLAGKSTPTIPEKDIQPGEWIKETRPDMVLITVGFHQNQVLVADDCIEYDVPYAINVQAASSTTFVGGKMCPRFRRWYQNAKKVFFVSKENQEKVETNLAVQLDNAEIVDNPFNVDFDVAIPYPREEDPLRLACVGRIHFQSKGQDLLVHVLKQPKWRERNITVSIYGKDQGQRFQLVEMIKNFGLEDKIVIEGFVNDVSEIWNKSHGMILPSRYEGAALVVIEAMLCNRVCIMTDTGRNRELCDDGKSSFIASSATARGLDEALERAWQARDQWKAMGDLAGKTIRERYSRDPIGDYAKKIKSILE